jgi:uncharacterized protein (TIGR02453 family)
VIQPQTLTFLRQLRKNNDKAWFDAHRKEYETAKKDFEGFVAELLKALIPLEAELANQQAKDCTYRIFRDVRFSKDKTPYKSHFGAFFARGGRKWDGAGYYLHLEPGAIFAGGGLWMPEPSLLKKVRQEIDYDFPAFKEIVDNKSFRKLFPKLNGEALSRPPQGYDVNNPAIEFLKMKSLTAGHPMKDEDLTSGKAIKNVVGVFTTLSPLINFLNRAQED